ncbi:MAG: phosphatase PAP2 family protein [Acidobacteriota bacterium]
MDPAAIRSFMRARFSREGAVGLYFTVSLLACLLLTVAFSVLAHEVFEHTITPGPLDGTVGKFLYGLRSPPMTEVMRGITFLGDRVFLAVGTAAVVTGLVVAGHRVSALLFFGSVAGGFGVTTALKIGFTRARPDLWPALVKETTYSFPSGHAAMSTVFFGGLAAVVFHLSSRRGIRILAVGAAAFFVIAVAVSRVYLGAHWATDTFAGVLVGLFWVTVYAAGTDVVSRGGSGSPRRRPGSPRSAA